MSKYLRGTITVIVFAIGLIFSQPNVSNPQRSPLATPTTPALRSPLPTPTLPPTIGPEQFDPYYRANPKKIKPHSVPYTDEYGDIIVEERVIEIPHHEPAIVKIKATQRAKSQNELSVQSQAASASLDYKAYLPLIQKAARPPVLVVVYRNKTPGYDPATLVNTTIADLRAGSIWHGYSNPNGQPGLEYGLTDGAMTVVYESPPTQSSNGYIDLNAVYQRFNICPRVQAGQVGEVWIWTDGDYPSYSPGEFVVNGPTWSLVWGGLSVPNCGKTTFTLLLNFDRSVSQAMESYAHSIEATMGVFAASGYEACDFFSLTLPNLFGPAPSQCTGFWAASDQYAFTARPAPVNSNIGVCGNVHWPPNLPVSATTEYYFSVQTPQQSRCINWQWNGGTVASISCTAWQCESCPDPSTDPIGFYWCNNRNEERYLIWWMQNLPGIGNNSYGRTGSVRPNWWEFRFR